jgi:uncharacterized protein
MPGRDQSRRMLGNISMESAAGEKTLSLQAVTGSSILSPFTFAWERGETFYLYHSLHQRRLCGDRRLKQIIRYLALEPSRRTAADLPPEIHGFFGQIIPRLLNDEFIVNRKDAPSALLDRYRRSPALKRTDFRLLYLLITHKCNLRCSYCIFLPEAQKHRSVINMSAETALMALSLFEDLRGDDSSHPSLILYGGEPLLNWKTLSALVRGLRKKEAKRGSHGEKMHIELFTNGTIVSREKALFLKEHQVRTIISLDGLEDHHDAMRRLASSGKGSFRKAMRGYHILREIGHQPSVSCTVGPHNFPHLDEIVHFFHRLGIDDIHFFPIKGLSVGNSLEISSLSFVRKIMEIWPLFREKGMRENILLDRLLQMKWRKCRFFDCEANGGMLAVAPDGSISPCINMAEEYVSLWGKVGDEGIKETILGGDLTTLWLRRSPLLMDDCTNCIGLGFCGGGCAHEAYVKRGSVSSLDPRQCERIPEIIRWAVETLGEE